MPHERAATTRSGTATRCTRSTAAGAGRSTRYAGDRMFVAEAWVDSPERLARYTAAGRAAHGVQLRLRRARRGTPTRCARTDRRVPRRSRGRRRAGHLGAVQPRRHPPRHPVRAGWTRPAAASRRGDRVGPDTPLDPELGLRRARAATLLMLALPGSAYVYQGEELGLPEVVDLPEDVLADPIWERSGHTSPRPGRLPGADPVDRRRPVARLRQRRRPGCRSRRPSPSCPVQAEQGVAGSTLELYRQALAAAAGRWRSPDRSTGCPRPTGSLSFRRLAADGSSVVCVVACTDAAVPLPAYDEVLVASTDLEHGPDGGALLPGDAAVWLQVR